MNRLPLITKIQLQEAGPSVGWCWAGGQAEQQKSGGTFVPPHVLSVPRAPQDMARLWLVDPWQRTAQVCPLSSALLPQSSELGALMHPHPSLKPEELTGISPSLQGLKPTQIKASFCGVGLPAQGWLWESFQCLHPFLTPSQPSCWLKAKLLSGHKKPSILPFA